MITWPGVWIFPDTSLFSTSCSSMILHVLEMRNSMVLVNLDLTLESLLFLANIIVNYIIIGY